MSERLRNRIGVLARLHSRLPSAICREAYRRSAAAGPLWASTASGGARAPALALPQRQTGAQQGAHR
eukprot:11417998-Heterocapsa_arctica.AAC.1